MKAIMSQPNEARNQLEDILKQKEYQVYYDDSQSFIEVWWEKTKAWIIDLLQKWFPSMQPTDGAATIVLISVLFIVVVLLMVVLYLIIRKWKRDVTFKEQKALQSLNQMHWSSQKHLLEADYQESLQNYALSTRHLFLGLLLYFQEREWLVVRLWKTNGEYYDDLIKVDHHGAELFYESALVFDRVTYGEGNIDKEEYIQLRNAVRGWLDKSVNTSEEE